MPTASPVPPGLEYLTPWLRQMPDDEIDEDPDTELLEQLLIERIASLSPAGAGKAVINIYLVVPIARNTVK